MIFIVAATMLRPGDAPWIYDEPLLMEMALQQNATPSHFLKSTLPFTPAPFGLKGTRGARYGPIAVWLDQIFLAFTHNPIHMVATRAALVSTLNAISLLWLCRTLRVSPWLAVAAMLSPWLYFYSRQIWDNSLCIPVSALMLAGYADFILTRRPWSLRLAVFCAPILLLIHFMAIPLVAAIALHLAIFEYRSLWRFKWSLAAITIVVFAISWPYWNNLIHTYHHNVPGGTSRWLGWFYPLLGPHHLSALGLNNLLGDTWRDAASRTVKFAQLITALSYAAAWIGMLLAIPALFRVVLRSKHASLSDHLFAIAWAAVIFQCAMYGPLHVHEGPHYFNASWICFFAFACLAYKFAPPFCEPLLPIYAAAQLFILTTMFLAIQRNAGLRSDNYGTSLADQIAAVQQMEMYADDSPTKIEIPEWTEHPRTPAVLKILYPPPPDPRPTRHLLIHFRDAFPGDARIEVTASPVDHPAQLRRAQSSPDRANQISESAPPLAALLAPPRLLRVSASAVFHFRVQFRYAFPG
jgi:hypothetical protein